LVLPNAENSGHTLLSKLPGLPQVLQSHLLGNELLTASLHLGAAVSRQAVDDLVKVPHRSLL
jgi:hypothetical protein